MDESKEPSQAQEQEQKGDMIGSGQRANIIDFLPWEVLVVSIIAFLLLLIVGSLDSWVAFDKQTQFSTETASDAGRGTSIALVGVGVLLPVLFFFYAFIKIGQKDVKIEPIPRQTCFIIGIITYILILFGASFGTWLCSLSEMNAEPALKVTFIVMITLGVILPFLFAAFYFRKQICEKLYPKAA